MSLVVAELNRAFHRSLVVAPTSHVLLDQLQTLGQELAAYGQHQSIDFNLAAPKEGPLSALMSARLGRRGNYDLYWMVFGMSLESNPQGSKLESICDSVWLVSDTAPQNLARFLAHPWNSSLLLKPALLHLSEATDSSNLAATALASWYTQKWPQGLFVEKPEELFPRGLEWILSF
jgi:hypothetical protein